MKKVTFTKLGVKGAREGYPGYLLLHDDHPGREFVLGCTSSTQVTRDTGEVISWSLTDAWTLYDRETGVCLLNRADWGKTREQAHATAVLVLNKHPPSTIQERIDRQVMRITTKLLKAA